MVKLALLLLWVWLETNSTARCQNLPYAKIYLGYSPFDIRTTLDPSTPLEIGALGKANYALLETDLDSLGLVLPKNRTVFLTLEAGKTYYYIYGSRGYQDVSANAFWLSQAATSARRYRHYILTKKSGVVKADDSDN